MKCEDFFSLKLDSFKYEDILPNRFCPLAFYTVFPYYLTLIHSGRFEWVKKGENVKVQCPKVDGVMMEPELLHQDTLGVRIKIIEIKGLCPRGHNKGDTFDLSLHL